MINLYRNKIRRKKNFARKFLFGSRLGNGRGSTVNRALDGSAYPG